MTMPLPRMTLHAQRSTIHTLSAMPTMSNLQELHDEIETFEAGATAASAALLSRYSELKKRCQENKIPIFALLQPKCRRVVITAFTSFGNATAIVKRLGGPPWNASIDDLIGAFGEETLLSESFLRALDDLAQMEPPPSWHETRQAITRASLERKASTGNTRIPRLRPFTPKDVVAAKSFLRPGVTVCNKRKKRGTLVRIRRPLAAPHVLTTVRLPESELVSHPSSTLPRTKN